MTPAEHVSMFLHFGLASIAVWIFAFYFWRQYRIDALRERLFQTRGELFDYAANGGVPFDHAAYGELRRMMNSMIRFAHRLTFTRVVFIFLLRPLPGKTEIANPLATWEKVLSTLLPEQQAHLRKLHDKMQLAIMWHIIWGS